MKKVKELMAVDYQARLWANVVHRRSCMSDTKLDDEVIRFLGLQRGTADQDFFYRFRRETPRATYALQSVDVSRVAREFEKALPGLEGTSQIFCSNFWPFLREAVPRDFDVSSRVVQALRDIGWLRLGLGELFALFPFGAGNGEIFRKELKRYLSFQLTCRRFRYSDGFVLDKLHALSLLLLEAQVNNWSVWENWWRRTLDLELNGRQFRALFNEANLDSAKARGVISASIEQRIAKLRTCSRPTGFAVWVGLSVADEAELRLRGPLVRQNCVKSREFVSQLHGGGDTKGLLQDIRALQQNWQDEFRALPRGRFGDFWNTVVL